MESQLVETWRKNNDANLFFLEHVTESGLASRYSERTRTVAAQFAHIHNVRVYHLDHRAPNLLGTLAGFAKGAQPKKSELMAVLSDSEEAIARFLQECEAKNKIRSWYGPPATWLGYLIAHEAHHRALALVSMRLSGEKLPEDLKYNIWNWGKKGGLWGRPG